MSNVLLLSLVFHPDNVSTAQLMGELTSDLRHLGHKLRVITTVPHYNPSQNDKATVILRWWFGPLVCRSEFDGTPVYHVWVPRKGKNLILRVFGWMLFHIVSTILACVIRFRPDVILAPSPPLTIGVSAWFISLVRRSMFVYNIQEVYPDVAIHLGLIKSRALIRAMYWLESFVYKRAKALTTISKGMQHCIINKRVSPSKVLLIPNFVDVSAFGVYAKENEFSQKHALSAKFVISYAGNMGKPQGLDVFIRAMGELQDLERVHLLMVGSGSEYESLSALARELKLSNVSFLPQQPYSDVPLIYACSDLSIVSQSVGTYSDGIPSKVYRIMGSGRSVLAYTREDSDLGVLIRDADAGLVVSSLDCVTIANIIRVAAQAPERWIRSGERAREFVAARYSRHQVSEQYSSLIWVLSGNAKKACPPLKD